MKSPSIRVRHVAAAAMILVAWPAAQAKAAEPLRASGILATLSDVAATSSASAWAVGYRAAPVTGPTRTLIQHWNGRTWSPVTSPDPSPSNNVLIGVSAIPGRAWAVGAYLRGSQERSLIASWNGRAWTRSPSPDPGTVNDLLWAVSAISPGNAWAVGYYQRRASGPDRTLIVHWNGTKWTQVKSPDPSTGSDFLYNVRAISARSAWAVGNYCVSRCAKPTAVLGTLILHWNGRAWSRIRSPSIGRANNILVGIDAVSARNAWATGYSCPAATSTCLSVLHERHLLILHWNGSAWSRVKVRSPGAVSELGEVTATSARNAWAAGDYCPAVRGCLHKLRTLILHWNGRIWSKVTSPNPGPASSAGGITATSAASAWAAGYYCTTASCAVTRALILHWNGRTWSKA